MDKKTVLIVDDNKGFLDELSESLRLNDYEVVAINDPSLALGIAAEKKPDLILLDLKMPGHSGFLLADEFKNSRKFAYVPIIAMSGYFKNKDSEFLNIYGFMDYLEKPFNIADLIAKIETALKNTV